MLYKQISIDVNISNDVRDIREGTSNVSNVVLTLYYVFIGYI